MLRFICLVLLLLMAFGVTGRGVAAGLRAGVASCDVTPPIGCNMWGYSAREGVAEQVHDPLMAKVLALGTDEGSLAIVTLDLGRCFDPDLREIIEKRAAASGIDNVIIVASHTHQGPDMETREWPSADSPWQDAAASKVADAVAEAAANMQPAVIGFGVGEVDLAHNRRLVMPDGSVRMFWRNDKREPTSPVDKTVRVLRVDATDGGHIALLVNYACHSVVLGPDNLMLSADYPGAMRRAVESKWGGQCLFAQGACGDINPYMDKTPLNQNGVEEMEKMGQALGAEVLRVATGVQTAPLTQDAVTFSRRVFELESRWEFSEAAIQALLKKYEAYVERMGEDRVRAYVERMAKGASVPATVAVLGDRYALCGFPGEFFVEHQLELTRRSPLAATMFFGYADGMAGYFPTIQAAVEGGYGAGYSTFVEVGAGERMVDAAVISILGAIGKLRPVPSEEVPDYPEEDEAAQASVDSLEAWFLGLPDSFNAEAAGDLKAVYYFNVTGEKGGDYAITVADGKCAVEQAKPEGPDVTVTIADADMLALARGELDPVAAYMGGKLVIDGDMSLALKMPEVFFGD
ncbi:MAG: neutral/alkaline non-lysosomal ceramidase N-terminal domain-containing protein [Armatimonadota bacterium]|nr:MAG: neutral/alkaline non-lysosomal ceramidase N-terminal domain-containing protein [Armatimonadota bacterium]